MRITKPYLLSVLLLLIPLLNLQARETDVFVINDLTGKLPPDRQVTLTRQAQAKLDQVQRFYGEGNRVDQLGKIRLEFDRPRGDIYATVFLMEGQGKRRTRVVRVFGVDREPQQVAHKLTHALFVSPDKLIRNMMGIPMEMRFGNPLSFPMCGYRADEWVAAFRRQHAYIPLAELGPNHEQWGMTTREGVPVTFDRARQHIMYAESAAFGDYLLATYGAEKMKSFWQGSKGGKRPWEQVFGLPLQKLEAQWLQALEAGKPDEKTVDALLGLFNRNPKEACTDAQRQNHR